MGVATLDVNDDAWPDLIVTNDTEADELYFNNRDGTFSERGVLSGMAFDENGQCLDEGTGRSLRKLAESLHGFLNDYVCPKFELERMVRQEGEPWSTNL